MAKPTQSVADVLISAAELGALVGVSRVRIGQLTGEGVLTKVAGKYRLGESVSKYIGHLREDARRSTQSAATVRTQEARARSIELRNAEKERALIPLEESLAAVDTFCGIVLVELGGLAALCGERDRALRQIVDGQVRIIQERIARRIGAVSEAHRSGASLDEAARRSAGNGPAA
jgi:hypothetical protein